MVSAPAGRVLLGVDLGKRQTPTTIVVLQQHVEPERSRKVWDPVHFRWKCGSLGNTMVVTCAESVTLGTSYDTVARRIWEVAARARATEIWMDGTGVGVAVEEMLRQRRPPGLHCTLRPITITGPGSGRSTSVARHELLSRLAVECERGRVRIAEGLPHWEALRQELLALDANGRKRHGRDDLALSLALAVWGFTGAGTPVGERRDGRLV